MQEIINSDINKIDPFAKNVCNALIKNKETKLSDDVDDAVVIHPIIFDNTYPESPIETPILSRINFEMLHDTNIEAMEKGCFKDEGFEYNIDLNKDQYVIIKQTILNNIIESTIMSFNNYWVYAKNNILNNVLAFDDEFVSFDFDPKYRLFEKLTNSIDLKVLIEGFIQTYLSSTNKLTAKNKLEILPDLSQYMNIKSTHITQYLISIIVETIYQELYKYLSEFKLEYIIEKSDLFKSFYNNGSNMATIIQQLVEYVLYESLYDFAIKCLNPSISNILISVQGTFFTCHADVLNYYLNNNNNDIL